ncbi:FIG01020671: hypothetical protein [hydrothermal vent metagenome]|uniref:Uncharacterized protein n=1 Tax=hydrothermal vent metagenome TaxID=652676 RepID=A0A3B1CTK9_9ZZZZ
MSSSQIVEEAGMGRLEVFSIDAEESTLFDLIEDIFTHYWQEIHFGVLVQGAVWEIKAPNAPKKISLLDGYVTVDFDSWHFHICIGTHQGSKKYPVDPELAAHRRTSRAELYRRLDGTCVPQSWALRFLNGREEQQMTIFLPNPFLTDKMKVTRHPDWSKLALWDHLRKKFLGLAPDDKDRHNNKIETH